MIAKLKHSSFYLILLTMLASCTERVDMELQTAGKPKLVVFGEITSDTKQHEIRLGKSAPYFYNKPMEAVSGGHLTIDDGDRKVTLNEDSIRPGIYLTPPQYSGKVGHHYRLDISNVDVDGDGVMETYHAETVMKPSAQIRGTMVVYNSVWRGWEVVIFSKSLANTKNYYLFKVYKNGTLYTDSISKYWTTDDRFLNVNEINGSTVQFFTKDHGEFVYKGDTVTIEMAGITKDYCDYINGVQNEITEKVPLFSGPSANVQGNISNGALGYFAVMAVQRDSYVYPGDGNGN